MDVLIYFVYFVEAILFMAGVNLLWHHVRNVYLFKKHPDRTSCRTTGRIVNFETGKSETQYGPKKSY